MVAIRYNVPYEVTFIAKDLGSGKPITNKWYFRCGTQTVSPPAYGAPIAGASDGGTFLLNLLGAYGASICDVLNHNYQLIAGVLQAIIGKRYSTPLVPIISLAVGPPVTLTFGVPHGLASGQVVFIQGVTSPVLANGSWVITVTSPTSFTLNGAAFGGVWSGDGVAQLVNGRLEFLYADKVQILSGLVGLVAGDALPLFATSSIRRLNGGVGRNWRSRVSLSPMSEVDVVDGAFTSTQRGLMSTALTGWLSPVLNGGSDTGSRLMYHQAISKNLAFAAPSPFAANTFSQNVTSMGQQNNCGSLTRRKPKLTQTIV